jgi:hypothetical protein
MVPGMRKLSILLLAVALLGAALFFFRSAPPAPGTGGTFSGASLNPPPPPVSAGQNLPPPAAPKPEEAASAFVDFLRIEAKSLDTVGIDAEAAERRAQSAASSMGPKEFQFARDVALSAASASGERIMAIFLLTSAGEAGWPALRNILSAPLSRDRVEPHTEAEHKSVQEKALRLMAVDALAEEAVTSERARAELRAWASATPDASLARTIQKKLDGLPPL